MSSGTTSVEGSVHEESKCETAPVAASPASFQPENAITITGERRSGIL